MPTYEYACVNCGTHVEVYQKFSDEPLSECGVCGGRLRKVFHPAGILFKGSGFYATDSRSGRRKAAEAKKEEAPAAAPKADTKSDAKSDAKTETKPESKGESKKEASA